MKFPHLLESYDRQIIELSNLETKLGKNNPKFLYWKAGAESTLASYYMANDDERFRIPLQKALSLRIESWKGGENLGAWDFILNTNVSLVLNDLSAFKSILEIDVKTYGYVRVTVEWFRLLKAIFTGENYTVRKVKKTKGEEKVFKALIDIMEDRLPEWSDFDVYWKSTRNRSHQFTMLQHRNLLKEGMMVFWQLKNENKLLAKK